MARREKILIALSGGPASAMAASLLRNQDCDLIGVFGKVTLSERLPESHCTPPRDEAKVQALCERLSIPLIVEDLTSAVEGLALAPLVEARIQGRVTDPCLAFHGQILLPRLWEVAQKSRATQIATGHFARISVDQESGKPSIYASQDERSDQSVLLAGVSEEILRHLLLPLSEIPETMMKKLAEEMGFSSPVAQSEETRTPWSPTCYPESTFSAAFVRRFAAPSLTPGGAIRSVEEYTAAEHSGLASARVGFPSEGILGQTVLNLVPATRTIIVGSAERLKLKTWSLREVHLRKRSAQGMKPQAVTVRIAGRPGQISGELDLYSTDQAVLRFENSETLPSPGQLLVFYDQNEAVGTAEIGDSPVKLEPK